MASPSKSAIISTSDSTSAIFASALPTCPIRLDGTNFLLWKTLLVPNLSGLNLHGHLDAAQSVPEKTITDGEEAQARTVPNPAYQLWWQQDQKVLGALLNSMTPDIVTQMVGFQTAAQVWKAVHDMFAAQNRATIRHTRLQLQTLKKRDMTAAAYFQKMKALADNLAAIGCPLTNDELIDYVLAGLGPQYGPLAASLTIANKDVSLTDFYAYLLSFEALQEQQTDNGGDWTSSVNVVTRSGNSSQFSHSRSQSNRSKGRQRPEHPDERSQSGGGRSGGSRNRLGGGRFRPRCQICRIHGHEAFNCHNRFNEAYNPDAPRSSNSADRLSAPDSRWYLDTGATDHLTHDLDRLTTQERYIGNDKIQVANGAGQGHEENSVSR